MSIEEIFAAWEKLNPTQQAEFARLQQARANNTATSIAGFSEWHQQKYGVNAPFGDIVKSGPDHEPLITVTLHTAFGEFNGTGSNQKIARLDAVQKAASNMPA